MKDLIPFNQVSLDGSELPNMSESLASGISGNGRFTERCHALLEGKLGARKVLLTHSCTAALEMSAILAGVGPGDEVIMPSYTFTSTANAFVLRGAVPVFVDIRPDTLNIDEAKIEAAISVRTRVICVVHYAGVSCEMDVILDIAERHNLIVVEDAAQALGASYRKRPLGTLGQVGAISFHESKNIVSGEGGALIVNDPSFSNRAEILWEKGTNRVQFKRGTVDKYTWIDVGSSFLPSDILAGFLFSQLSASGGITHRRKAAWARYHEALADIDPRILQRPVVPPHCEANGHIYFMLAPDRALRDHWVRSLNADGINAVTHYVPLHSAPAGLRFGRAAGTMTVTDDTADRLLRLPMYADLSEADQDRVVAAVRRIVLGRRGSVGRRLATAGPAYGPARSVVT
jgi:dTDP-4-amino-4,6-dideoxygalactose transaminase